MKKEPSSLILVLEDDAKLAESLVRALQREGFSVRHTQTAEQAERILEVEEIDLLISDLMLPGMDGLTLLKHLRAEARALPVLILSAKGSVAERVEGLRLGADDNLIKPFAFDELLARVRSLLRRSLHEQEEHYLREGDLRVDLFTRRVWREETEMELQPQEYALLIYLLKNRGRIVTRSMILQDVWGYQAGSLTNVVESRICRLRNKIDKGFSRRLIHTVRGRGYVLSTEEK